MQAADYANYASKSFALPDICVRLRELLDDGCSDANDIAQVVSMDPSVSSKLLRLANSSLFRFQSQIYSISKAINVIGGEALYNLVMAETASTAFRHFSQGQADSNKFWQQSFYCGLVAKHLAKIMRIRGSERFFLMGLLHDLGEIVVACKSPQLARQAQEFDYQVLPWQKQQEVFGFTYADVSAAILEQWHLPDPITYPIGQLHNEQRAMSSIEVGLLYTAARVALEMVEQHIYAPNMLANALVLEHLQLHLHHLKAAVRFAKLEANSMIKIMQN